MNRKEVKGIADVEAAKAVKGHEKNARHEERWAD